MDDFAGFPVVTTDEMPKGRVAVVSRCPNCEGRGYEGRGDLEDDYPCRTCKGCGRTVGLVALIDADTLPMLTHETQEDR